MTPDDQHTVSGNARRYIAAIRAEATVARCYTQAGGEPCDPAWAWLAYEGNRGTYRRLTSNTDGTVFTIRVNADLWYELTRPEHVRAGGAPRFGEADRAYLRAVRAAAPEAVAPWRTRACPDCDETPAGYGGLVTGHVIMGGAVVMGCRGYRVIDPAALGLPRGGWLDWRDDSPYETTGHVPAWVRAGDDSEPAEDRDETGRAERAEDLADDC